MLVVLVALLRDDSFCFTSGDQEKPEDPRRAVRNPETSCRRIFGLFLFLETITEASLVLPAWPGCVKP